MSGQNQKGKSFELQLLVIAILIPVYLEILPKIIRPVQLYFNFSMELPMIFSYLMGGLWFICLLFGTFYLAFDDWIKEKSLKIYEYLFKLNNTITVSYILILFTAYSIVFLNLFLSPFFRSYLYKSITLTVIIILGLVILIVRNHFKNKKRSETDEKQK